MQLVLPSCRAAALLVAACALPFAPARAAVWPSDTTLGLRVCAATGDQIEPLMVGDEVGGFILLWTDYRKPGNDPDLYCQRVSASGDTLWGPGGTVVCDAVGIQIRPTLIADGLGGAFMAWVDLRSSGAIGYYLQHIAADGTRQWAANGIRPVGGLNSQFGPQICRDGTGGVFLAFASGNPGTQIQRIDSLGIKRLGAFPPAEGPLLRGNPSAPLGILPDDTGGAIVAVGYGGSTPVDIAAQRVSEAGAQLWAVNGVTVCAATGAQANVSMVSDGAEGAIFAWEDSRNTGSDIYAQRVSAAGSAQWAADGIALCTAAELQTGVRLRAQADGSAVAAWRDYRHLPATSLHAQRVQGDGTVAWSANGLPVCSALLAIDRYSVTAANGDSTFVVWNSTSGASGDVFAQKLDGAGATQWAGTGVTVCQGPLDQTASTSATDGLGGLYVAYRVGRVPSDPELYAHHVGPDGLPGPIPTAAAVGTWREGEWVRGSPNPARGALLISFSKPAGRGERLEVIDIRGRRRATVTLAAGATSWNWDCRADDGTRVGSGVYPTVA